MHSPNGLFLIATLIWGSTWFAIRFQLGSVAPEVSVAYRFALAAALLLSWGALTGVRLRYTWREHLLMAAQGVFMFGANYILIYHSERFLTSGLVAVIFSVIIFFNIIGMRLFFAQPIELRMVMGALLGVGGVVLLFAGEVLRFGGGGQETTGLLLATGAMVIASVGNLLANGSYRAGLPVQASTGFGMLYGALFVAMWVVVRGVTWTFVTTPAYLVSLAYLAVFGSVVAFVSYLTLAAKIGADRAAYVGISTPVVALFVSTILEGYRWTLAAGLGVVLCLLGNVLVLIK